MTEQGTEKRVDELSKRVDFGFEQVDKRLEQIDKRFDRFERDVDRRFDRVEGEVRELRAEMKDGFDSLHRLMIQFFAGTVGSIAAGVVVLLVSHS